MTNVGGFSDTITSVARTRTSAEQLIASLEKLSTSGSGIIPRRCPLPLALQWTTLPQPVCGFRLHPSILCGPGDACLSGRFTLETRLQPSAPPIPAIPRSDPSIPPTCISGCRDVDGEGLQIEDGDIDWVQLFQQINQHCPAIVHKSGKDINGVRGLVST